MRSGDALWGNVPGRRRRNRLPVRLGEGTGGNRGNEELGTRGPEPSGRGWRFRGGDTVCFVTAMVGWCREKQGGGESCSWGEDGEAKETDHGSRSCQNAGLRFCGWAIRGISLRCRSGGVGKNGHAESRFRGEKRRSREIENAEAGLSGREATVSPMSDTRYFAAAQVR